MTENLLPDDVEKYAETPIFTQDTVPAKLLDLHDTKPGVWGRIIVIDGELDYSIPGPVEQTMRLNPKRDGIIRPAELHRVTPVGNVQFKVEFLKQPKQTKAS